MDEEHKRVCMDGYLVSTKERRTNQAALEGALAISRVGILEYRDCIEAYRNHLTFAAYGKNQIEQ